MKVKVKVPATSANLGPGFDVAGLALTLYNTFTFELNEGGLNITGCPTQFCNEENLTYQAFSQAAQSCGLDFKGVNIHCESQVPYTRGLGSSSTCIVAGIVGAFAFKDKTDDRQEILELATKIEGHPDNVAPAIFEESRKVLPQTLGRQDAIKNVSHLALVVASLINGYDDGLKLGFKDRLHQPYRGKLIHNYDEIMNVLENDENVLGCYLSGAGPTLMAVIREEDKMGVVRLKEELGSLLNDWEVIKLELDHKGYTCDYE